jgi:hypothetical protein
MLPSLLRKAAGDAGFDLALGSEGSWECLGVSGVAGCVWLAPDRAGAWVAVDSRPALGEIHASSPEEITPPPGAVGAVRCETHAAVFDALRRIRVFLATRPPLPQERLAARLARIDSTEAETVVHRRVGQELFREMLLEYWGGKCAVTGLDVPDLLRASHAKPWADSTDVERLDVHNGLLLAVHLDALFDRGFVTFATTGQLLTSTQLLAHAREVLLPFEARGLSRVAEGHRRYLAYHARHVFHGGSA